MIGCSTKRKALLGVAQEAGDWLMSDANQLDRKPERASVPEPSWWNMVIPFIIIIAGIALGFLGVM